MPKSLKDITEHKDNVDNDRRHNGPDNNKQKTVENAKSGNVSKVIV